MPPVPLLDPEIQDWFRVHPQNKAGDVLVPFDAHVETIPIVLPFYQVMTALQRYPWRGRQARHSHHA